MWFCCGCPFKTPEKEVPPKKTQPNEYFDFQRWRFASNARPPSLCEATLCFSGLKKPRIAMIFQRPELARNEKRLELLNKTRASVRKHMPSKDLLLSGIRHSPAIKTMASAGALKPDALLKQQINMGMLVDKPSCTRARAKLRVRPSAPRAPQPPERPRAPKTA